MNSHSASDQKPIHLSAEYAAQFNDASVVSAYSNRPPYPNQVFDALVALLPPESARVLELGSGTGDLTLGLAPRVVAIDALEPSEHMIEHARSRAEGVATNIRWIHARAEDFSPTDRYALVVAAESIHWMEWTPLMRMLERALRDDALLAIVMERKLVDVPWLDEARRIVARHSTNTDYRTYDVISELSQRSLFRELGRQRCVQAFSQTVDSYIESFHSRNGFSRDRMSPENAMRFDTEMRRLVLAHAPAGVVICNIETAVVWGRPEHPVRERE